MSYITLQRHPRPNHHPWRKIRTCFTSHHNIIAAPPQTQPHPWRKIRTCLTSHHDVIAAPPQTQPHPWCKIRTWLTSHQNVIAAPPQTQPHDHVHRTKMHEYPGAVLDDVSTNKYTRGTTTNSPWVFFFLLQYANPAGNFWFNHSGMLNPGFGIKPCAPRPVKTTW